jgi:hypothetical protein
VALVNVTVTDPKLGLIQTIALLPTGESAQVTGSYGPITEADLPGPIVNTAVVTGTTRGGEPTQPVTDTHETPVAINPGLTLVKTASSSTFEAIGDVIVYSYTLTNNGDVTLYGPFSVEDDKTTVTCPAEPASLATGQSIVCTASYVITEADFQAEFVTNVAVGKAKDPTGADVPSNEATETVTKVTDPTNLPGEEQPNQLLDLFLPSIASDE